MKNRIITCILLVATVLSLTLGAAAAEATEATEPTNVPREPGYCGESITWTVTEGALTIVGTGKMDDFPEGAPWADQKNTITTVVISDGITYVGAYAFRDFDALESVTFGDDVYEIGKEAFCSCEKLTEIHLPAAFKVFGEASFMACKNLKQIHCEGRFPSFKLNCFWDTYATIYFPAERPWGVEYIQQLEEAFHGRIEFRASDGTDPYEPTQATETTEATEAETVPPTTVPPTTAPTQPSETVTEPTATTVPETTAAPTEETQPPTEMTVPETTAPASEEESGGVNWIPLAIIGASGGFLILGSLIFRLTNRRGRYSSRRRRR